MLPAVLKMLDEDKLNATQKEGLTIVSKMG